MERAAARNCFWPRALRQWIGNKKRGSGDMPSAEYYRAKARECLVLAKSVKSPEAAQTLWMLAHDYLALANHASDGDRRDDDDHRKH